METLVLEFLKCVLQNRKEVKQLRTLLDKDKIYVSGDIRQPGNEAFFVFGGCCFSIQRIVKKNPDSNVASSAVHVLHYYPNSVTDTQALIDQCNSARQPVTVSFDYCQGLLWELLNEMEGKVFNVDSVFFHIINKYAKKPSDQESV